MKYISTRGTAPELTFEEAMLTGLARDGGLYVPAEWPQLGHDQIAGFAGKSYEDVAFEVMKPFIGDTFTDAEFKEIIAKAYAVFGHKARCPIVQLDSNDFLLELFHGPTLAFKDVALQFLGNVFEHILEKTGDKMNIVGATSGDTGSAAIYGVRGKDRINIFILHPYKRVSPIQELQMTTVTDPNVFNLAIKGTFDDGQGIVKSIFNDIPFKE